MPVKRRMQKQVLELMLALVLVLVLALVLVLVLALAQGPLGRDQVVGPAHHPLKCPLVLQQRVQVG